MREIEKEGGREGERKAEKSNPLFFSRNLSPRLSTHTHHTEAPEEYFIGEKIQTKETQKVQCAQVLTHSVLIALLMGEEYISAAIHQPQISAARTTNSRRPKELPKTVTYI